MSKFPKLFFVALLTALALPLLMAQVVNRGSGSGGGGAGTAYLTNLTAWGITNVIAGTGISMTTNNGVLTVSSTGTSGPTTNAPPYVAAINSALGSTNILINMLALGATNTVRATLTANAGIIFTNVIDGMPITLELIQDSTGNRSISTNATWGFNIRLDINSDLTLSLGTNASTKELKRFIGSGTNALLCGRSGPFSL